MIETLEREGVQKFADSFAELLDGIAGKVRVVAARLGLSANPLEEGLGLRRKPDPCALIIFGASGDLTHRKLFPRSTRSPIGASCPSASRSSGVARTEQTDEQFEREMREAVQRHGRDPFSKAVWNRLADGLRYVSADFADEAAEDDLAAVISELEAKKGLGGNRVYYLAIPPQAFETSVREIGERQDHDGLDAGHRREALRPRRLVRPPLSDLLHRWFGEDEIFRIDHYLGKETVQNMLALRFANGIFEPVWNRQFIDHVQITVAESMGIEGRAGFYERSGAIRDVFQNHLLQLLALTAMEPPIDFTADAVRTEKVKALRSLHTPGPKSVVRGQYGRGWIEGVEVQAYREENGVGTTR